MVDEHVLRELIRDTRRGHFSRRSFISTLTALGVTAPMASWLLSGCAGQSAPNPPPSSGAPAAASPPSAPPPAASPAFLPAGASMQAAASPAAGSTGRTKRGGDGVLKLLWWQAPSHANAHISTGTKDFDAARLFMEPLASFDRDGNFVPILATQIPSRENEGLSADGRSVTWRLKPDVTWHDGKPLTTDDVVFTWEYVIDTATAATSVGVYRNIDRIDRVDNLTCKVIFKEPTPGWYNAFFGGRGHIFPKHLISEYKGANARNSPYNLRPVGTGPYKIADFKVEDVVLAELYPNYHLPNLPAFDRVEMKGGGDATSAVRAVMQSGDYDFAWNAQVEWEVLQGFQRFGKGEVAINPGSSTERVQFNFTDPSVEIDGERSSLQAPHPFFSDIKVRQAFSLAMDRKAVVDQLYGPTGDIALNALVQPKIVSSPNTTWEFNLDKANKLLDEAGWARGADGIRAKNGKRMSVIFQTSTNSVRQKTQAIVKAGLEKIGVECELKSVDGGVYFNNDPGNWDNLAHFGTDLQMYTTGPGSPDPQDFMINHVSTEVAQKANQWRGRNVERWRSEDYDKLWREAQTELDPVKRAALFIKMNDLVINDFVHVPLVARNGVSARSTRLKNVDLTTWDSNLWQVRRWELA